MGKLGWFMPKIETAPSPLREGEPLRTTQLRKSAPPYNITERVQSMQKCTHDIKSWMSNNKLKPTDDKTDVMIVSSHRTSTSLPIPDSLAVGTSKSQVFTVCQKLQGNTRCTSNHEHQGCKSSQNCQFQTPMHQPHSSLFFGRSYTDVYLSLCLVRLDYCKSLLYGCPQNFINRLQKVQNNAARPILI